MFAAVVKDIGYGDGILHNKVKGLRRCQDFVTQDKEGYKGDR